MIRFLRRGFIHDPYSHYALVLALVLGGMGLASSEPFGWASRPLMVAGGIVAVLPLVGFAWRRLRIVTIFVGNGDGKEYIEEELRRVCASGGSVFSTYLMESAVTDVVTNIIKGRGRMQKGKSGTLRYRRFIMIDDPTQERAWIRAFLSTRIAHTDDGRVAVEPEVYAIKSPSRPIVRLIRSVVPRASLTLIDRRGSDPPIVYLSVARVKSLSGSEHEVQLSFAVRARPVYSKVLEFMENIIRKNPDVRTLQAPDDYGGRTQPSNLEPLIDRLLSEIEEMALTDIRIKHVGLFGGVAAMRARRYSRDAAGRSGGWRPESDLDLLIVIDDGSNKEDVKSLIKKRFLDQRGPEDSLEIEWSNEQTAFYYFRERCHVDVQLHYCDDYYYARNQEGVRSSVLLGYSIFCGEYHQVYSEHELPVDRFIHVPDELLDMRSRARLFISDPLGLDVFISKCQKGDPKIDPRRVLATNIVNLAWVLTGMRPVSLEQAREYLAGCELAASSDGGAGPSGLAPTLTAAGSILGDAHIQEHDESAQATALQACVDILKDLKAIAESLAGGAV